MNIRLVALDMDGTLLDDAKKQPVDFKQWVREHPDILTVIASGRQYQTLRRNMQGIEDLVVYDAVNGALVFDHGENIYCNRMTKQNVLSVLAVLNRIPGLAVIMCAVQAAYMLHGDAAAEAKGQMYFRQLQFLDDLEQCPELNDIVQFSIFCEQKNAAELVKLIPLPNDLHSVVSGSEWIDITTVSVNKGTGILILQRKYGIPPDACMAFGDAMNDAAMLKVCTESYAMKNGMAELKKAARYVTKYSNNEDGVMHILRGL